MNRILTDKIILVIGNTATVGAGIIRSFLLENATVIFPAKSCHEITMLKEGMVDINTSKLVTLLTDYPDYDKAFEIVETVMDQFGKIDITVVCFDKPIAATKLIETSIMDWEKMIDQNITAYFVCARIVLGLMKEHKQGMFINIVNMDGIENTTSLSLVNLSAGMQEEMIKIFYAELKHFKVRCHHLFINNLKTPDIYGNVKEKNRQITPETIASYIMKLYNGQVADSESLFHWLPYKPGAVDISVQTIKQP